MKSLSRSTPLAVVACSLLVHQAFAVQVVLWRSVRTHGGLGAGPIPLDALAGEGGSPTVEPRSGGIQRIEVDFDGPAGLSGSPAISVQGVSHDAGGNPLPPVAYAPTAFSLINSGMTLQIDFASGLLPDETCYRIDLIDAIASLTGDTDCYVRALVGDAGGSGSVTLADALAVKAKIGQPPLSNAAFDIIPGSSINLSDAIFTTTRIGKLVTCANLCPPPLADCNGGSDGCEVNLNTDVGNCGSCGHACSLPNATAGCNGGGCTVASCNAGFNNCDNEAANGCEINVNSDPNNCGSCGHVCDLPNATEACSGGACTIASCNDFFLNCDNNAANGCEINPNFDINNCGNCGHVCDLPNAAEFCNNGTCSLLACNAGFKNCDNNAANGCEINANTDPNNCGACGNVCNLPNATEGCSGGSCTVTSCNAPFRNCDNNAANGCEINTNTDVANCGTCGNACNLANATSACSSGACTLASCSGENYDVDNNSANGCEALDSGGPHTQGAATSLGSHDCFDTPTVSFNGTILSDSRTHPAVTGFDGSVGAAPDWRKITATGGVFCSNDYSVTFTTTGGSAAACYKCTIMTSVKSQFVIVNGTGSATMSSGGSSYGDNTTIYFKVEKTCGVASQEAVSYTVNFHL